MSNPVIRYPLDLTGLAPTNLVAGEPHSIPSNGNRVFVPNYGPFYVKSLKVRRASNGQLLTRGTHYKAAQLFIDATLKVGQEICTVIVITDNTIGNDFTIDYQVLGGDYSSSVTAIEQMIDSLSIDNRSVDYGQLIGKPEQFPPAPHPHDVGDLYGFEYLCAMLESIRRAILYGDEASHTAIYQYVDHYIDLANDRIDGVSFTLNNHVQDRNNPHGVTKTQVGLSNVENYALASQLEAEQGLRNDRYMTPLRTKQAIAIQAGDLVNQHIADKNNPHAVTKTQVGLGNVDNFATADQAAAEAGVSNTLFMTPLRTKQAITQQAGSMLNAHVNNLSNPHQVTKGQVGLGSVDNFPMATLAEVTAPSTALATPLSGLPANRFMSPDLVGNMIERYARTALRGHVNDTANPHGVTKAQVGLGSVVDAKQVINSSPHTVAIGWNGTELRGTVNGSDQGRIFTTMQPDPNLSAHTNNTNNPHGVTKNQIGLSLVANYPPSTDAEAIAGTATDRYISPANLRAAILARESVTAPYHWGFWRDSTTGYTVCWGRSPLIAAGSYYYFRFRRVFNQVFSITLGSMCRNIDASAPGEAQPQTEIIGQGLLRTLSTTGFAVQARRLAGTGDDRAEISYVAHGITDAAGPGGVNPGEPISEPTAVDRGAGDGYWSGGWYGSSGNWNTDPYPPAPPPPPPPPVPSVVAVPFSNLNFEAGDTGWSYTSGYSGGVIRADAAAVSAPNVLSFPYGAGTYPTTHMRYNDGIQPCTPGSVMHAGCLIAIYGGTQTSNAYMSIVYYDASGNFISSVPGNNVTAPSGAGYWRACNVTATAPSNAAWFKIKVEAFLGMPGYTILIDSFDPYNYVTAPYTGGGGGGGGGETGCIATSMYLRPDLRAVDAKKGDIIDRALTETEGSEEVAIDAIQFSPQPCYRMVTESGCEVIASDTTPMTLRDGSSKLFHQMANEYVLVDDHGRIEWERVRYVEWIGIMPVAVISIHDQCYFAGTDPNRRIATHNVMDQKEIQ